MGVSASLTPLIVSEKKNNKVERDPPWFNLNTNCVAIILYHLLYSCHEREKVFVIWRGSRALQPYLHWYKRAFDQHHSYRLWCRFLKLYQQHRTRSPTMDFDVYDAKFSVTTLIGAEFAGLTQSRSLPVVRRFYNHSYSYVDDEHDCGNEYNHEHDSFKSMTFAKDDDLFFVMFARDCLYERCYCFGNDVLLLSRHELAAIVTDVSWNDETHRIRLTIKWGVCARKINKKNI
jgi:hypothetical protein